MKELNTTINRQNLNNIYSSRHPTTAECTFFSSTWGPYIEIYHILGQNTDLHKFKRIKTMQTGFSEHNEINVDIGSRKNWMKMRMQHTQTGGTQSKQCWEKNLQHELYTLEKRGESQNNNRNSHLKNLEKQKIKPKKAKVTNIGKSRNQWHWKQNERKSLKQTDDSWKCHEMNKTPARKTKKRRYKLPIPCIRNERDHADITRL